MEMSAQAQASEGASSYGSAVEMYSRGEAFIEAEALGVSERSVATMSGMSIGIVRECKAVALRYPTKDEFLNAFNSHPIPQGMRVRTWSTFLTHIGLNVLTPDQVAKSMASIKELSMRIVMAANGSADSTAAQQALGALRSWLANRVPTVQWSTVDLNFFQYATCSYCGERDPVDPEVVPVDGLLSSMCSDCRSQGATPVDVNWNILAHTYAAYAFECNNASEILRSH